MRSHEKNKLLEGLKGLKCMKYNINYPFDVYVKYTRYVVKKFAFANKVKFR